MRGRMALWAVLAAIIVAVGAIIVVGGGDDSTTLARLPISLGSSGGGREAAMSADSMMYAPVTYVLDDGVPAMGGDADAFRLVGSLDDQRVDELASALGMGGAVQRDGDRAYVEDGDRILEVYGVAGLPWNMYDTKGMTSSGVAVGARPTWSSARSRPSRSAQLTSRARTRPETSRSRCSTRRAPRPTERMSPSTTRSPCGASPSIRSSRAHPRGVQPPTSWSAATAWSSPPTAGSASRKHSASTRGSTRRPRSTG